MVLVTAGIKYNKNFKHYSSYRENATRAVLKAKVWPIAINFNKIKAKEGVAAINASAINRPNKGKEVKWANSTKITKRPLV